MSQNVTKNDENLQDNHFKLFKVK